MCERVEGWGGRSLPVWLGLMVKVWLFLPPPMRALPFAERIGPAAALLDFADLGARADLATGFGFRAGADFFAAGAVRAAGFLAGFFGADFLVERAIKLMGWGAFPARPE